jgi:hypothetical protein
LTYDEEFSIMKEQKKTESNKDVDSIILATIDEVLSLLGKSLKDEIYFHLWRDFGINKKNIPSDLTKFSNALEKILGEGAKLIEINFMKEIHQKIKSEHEWDAPDWIVPDLTLDAFAKLKKQNIQKSEEICEMRILLNEPKQSRT